MTEQDKDARIAELESQLKSAREVIEFYAELMDWDRVNNPACIQDKGKRAREWLDKHNIE